MTLSTDQDRALDALARFIEAPRVDRPYRTLHGLAGTGKTFLLAELVRRYPGLKLTAFTGKAASVLRKRVNVEVRTLHSRIYDFKGLVDDPVEEYKKNPIFTPKGEPLPNDVIAVDEISMVGARIAQDLLDTGARVIACGDPGQLPPVRDKQFFVDPDYELVEVHRQAWDSPIVRQAHAVRSRRRYEADGDAFRVVSYADKDELTGHEIILCWRNRTRQRLNARIRQFRGYGPALLPGEPLMCLKNDHRLGVYNGAIYEVGFHDPPGLRIVENGVEIEIPAATVEGFDPDFDYRRYEEDFLPFAPAYAVTVHKSQGSEYPSVLLFDEFEGDAWANFMYTGITRAVERCTVVRWRS